LRREMKKINKTAFIVGTSIAAGIGATAVSADSNPFEVSELSSGYMNVAEADMVDVVKEGVKKVKDGVCGEGKCGGKMAGAAEKAEEGKCAGKMEDGAKKAEGKCGEGKCGDKKMGEGKAAEGKCGDKKMGEGKAAEGKCGDKKMGDGKAAEGKCGDKK
jgi:uncharacterized low-complexity protein